MRYGCWQMHVMYFGSLASTGFITDPSFASSLFPIGQRRSIGHCEAPRFSETFMPKDKCGRTKTCRISHQAPVMSALALVMTRSK